MRYAANGEIELLCSIALAVEYRAVLLRSEHLRASGISAEEGDRFLDALEVLATEVKVHMTTRPATRDDNDDFVWDVVVSGRADALVTFNDRDFSEAGKHFGVPVLTPRDALALFIGGRRYGRSQKDE